MRPWLCLILLLLLTSTARAAESKPPVYFVDYTVGFEPDKGLARVEIRVTPASGRLMRFRFRPDPERHDNFSGEGRISEKGGVLTWRPPKQGPASLRFTYKVARRRSNGAFDARITSDWALLRADRLIPPAAVISPGLGVAQGSLRFVLPRGWSNAEVGYRFVPSRLHFRIANPGRRFQQPVGWMIAGDVGTRREMIEGTEIVVGAPKGDEVRRNDILSFLIASLGEVKTAFGRLPKKLLIVSAGDPMWRGGLSAPNSLYLHAERPLVGENGTSPLMHELAHVVTRIRGVRGQDWIAESFAEYYSVQLLLRAGLTTESRAQKALQLMRQQGRKVRRLDASYSAGPRTGRGVTLLVALDKEIRKASSDKKSLDNVTGRLVGRGRISLHQLREAAEKVLGRPSTVLLDPILGEE